MIRAGRSGISRFGSAFGVSGAAWVCCRLSSSASATRNLEPSTGNAPIIPVAIASAIFSI